MPRNIDNIIPPERRKSIRNIPIPETRRRTSPVGAMDGVKKSPSNVKINVEDTPLYVPQKPMRREVSNGSRFNKKIILSSILALLVIAFGVLSMMESGVLTYTPKMAAVNLNGQSFAAYKSGETGLMFSVIKLSADKSLVVPATGEKEVSRKSTGTIVIYNNTSAEPQNLVQNTRFETADGKIYRIDKAVTIPGRKTVSGTAQPGSIEVTVTADAPGTEYNIPLSDFTVPGLKGTPRYTTIYARSKTPMSGGFVGKEKTVAEATLKESEGVLKEVLSEEILAKAQAEVPTDFVLFPSLSSLTFETLPQTESSTTSNVNLNMRGHLYGVMFKKTEISAALAKDQVQLGASDLAELESFSNLNVSYAGTAPTNLLETNRIDFKVTGVTNLVWRTDEVSLKSSLAGRKKSDVPQILKNFPSVESASSTVWPFWSSTFPEENAKITIKKENLK